MLDYLRNMGAVVKFAGKYMIISQGKLKAIEADFSDCIDLLPTLAVVAALGEGVFTFVGVERGRLKESNRVTAIKEGLEKMGVNVVENGDRLIITGLKTPHKSEDGSDETRVAEAPLDNQEEKPPVVINSYGDHRIAMAFGIMGAALGDVIIEGAECVAKTYPDFWEALKSVGGKITISE